MSYSIFSYLESSVHDKDSFAKEQSKFSGSKSLNAAPKPTQSNIKAPNNTTTDTSTNNVTSIASTSEENTGFTKRMTVAELFLKESEQDMKKETAVTETIEKFDKMDLYKSIFLSDDEDDEPSSNISNKPSEVSAEDFVDKPKNVERNLSPPRGIFANIDFDEINSWKRNTKPDTQKDKVETQKDAKEENNKDSTENDANVYGPKIPENLKKRLESVEEKKTDDNFRPKYRSKTEMETVEVDSSSSSDSWVDAKEVKSKKTKKEKKKKKHKSKHKKSKHKKKDR